MELHEALILLAVVQAAGNTILAVLLFRKSPSKLERQRWVERERQLAHKLRRKESELEASRRTNAGLRASMNKQ